MNFIAENILLGGSILIFLSIIRDTVSEYLPCCSFCLSECCSEETGTQLRDLTLTAEMMAGGNRPVNMDLPHGTPVMPVKRGSEFIIPNGQVELKVGDKLLLVNKS